MGFYNGAVLVFLGNRPRLNCLKEKANQLNAQCPTLGSSASLLFPSYFSCFSLRIFDYSISYLIRSLCVFLYGPLLKHEFRRHAAWKSIRKWDFLISCLSFPQPLTFCILSKFQLNLHKCRRFCIIRFGLEMVMIRLFFNYYFLFSLPPPPLSLSTLFFLYFILIKFLNRILFLKTT